MPANNTYPSYRDTINRIGICLCIMLALIQGTSLAWALLSGFLSAILPAESAYFTGVLIETVSYLSYFIIPAVLFVPLSNGRERQPVRFDIRMPAFFPLLILAGLAAISAAAQVNAWLMTLIGYTTDVTVSYAGGTDPQAIALFITVSLAPAFCEELLFRGVIYGNLRPYGVPLAVTVSALLFALMHGNIAQTFYTFVAGVVMALCYELSGSIWSSTFLHLFNNLSACVAQILLARLGEGAEMLLYVIDLSVMVAGTAAALALLLFFRHRKPDPPQSARGSLFGNLPESLPPVQPMKPNFGTAFRKFFTPGMTAFLVLELLCTAATALTVYLAPYLEGLLS